MAKHKSPYRADQKTDELAARSRQEHHDHDIKKLANLIKDINVAMFTTVDKDGTLHSRPMATQQFEFDGRLWFMTREGSPKVRELLHDRRVNVSYAGPGNSYVSVSGVARLVFDQSKIRELWSPLHKAWFPKGSDDPDLALIEVEVQQAEYWESPPSAVVKLAGFAKALLTGHPVGNDHGKKLDLVG